MLFANSRRRTWQRFAPGLRRSTLNSGISNSQRMWPQAGSNPWRRRPYRICGKGGVLICETPSDPPFLGPLSSPARRRPASRRPVLCPVAQNPRHPSLHFKQVGRFWAVRVGLHYRAVAVEHEDNMLWFWIGSHADYDKLLGHAESHPRNERALPYVTAGGEHKAVGQTCEAQGLFGRLSHILRLTTG